MARRFRWCGLGPLLALALACPGARAASVDVTTTTALRFSPPTITITQGDTVVWSNPSGGYHNVHFDDGLFEMPPDPTATVWSYPRTFMQPGTYTYYCEAHQMLGMTGTVVVDPAPPEAAGATPGPGSAPGSGTSPDVAPISSFTSPARQRVARLYVRASMNEAGTLTAVGAVGVRGGAARVIRFKRASRAVTANQSVKLRLRLAKKALTKVRRVLLERRLRASVTLTATDTTGKQTVRRLTIRLRR